MKKFGFKFSRSKEAMISLLEECWRATQQPTTQKLTQDIDSTTDTPTQKMSQGPEVSSPALLLRLHKRITQVIKSDIDQSVYLGILRYEPVVIEELVEWLERRDVVVPGLVIKGWCDKEGVCCIGRDSLAGGRKIR